jgi:flagellar protein FlaI
LITNIKVGREEQVVNYANIIARRVGKQITVLSPLLDAHLVTGDRINAVLYPVNTKGNTITIRKFARDPFTIVDMITSKTCSIDVASLLWLAIEYEMNVLISGGTGSGKTSFLNSCLPFIPPNQRIISIEDTRELMLPDFLYWAPLVTRTPNPEGKGEVSMLHLLVNSLRMRPDRIILGEMRKQEEAMVLFEAMHTGHSVYSTVHADSAHETISRLVNPPLNVPPNLLKTVNLNVVMFRDRRKGIRRAFQVAEFDADKGGAKATILYRWVADRDEIVKHSESSKFFEDLSRNTGMNDSELRRDLQEKKDILNWLIKNESRSLGEIGKVMNMYYRNKEMLIKAMHSNNKTLVFGKQEKKQEKKEVASEGGFGKGEVIEAVKVEPSGDKKEREKQLDDLMKETGLKPEEDKK